LVIFFNFFNFLKFCFFVFCDFTNFISLVLFQIWWDYRIIGLSMLIIWSTMMWWCVWTISSWLLPWLCQYSICKNMKKIEMAKKSRWRKKWKLWKFYVIQETLPLSFSMVLTLIIWVCHWDDCNTFNLHFSGIVINISIHRSSKYGFKDAHNYEKIEIFTKSVTFQNYTFVRKLYLFRSRWYQRWSFRYVIEIVVIYSTYILMAQRLT
jgi:hypothetical protein